MMARVGRGESEVASGGSERPILPSGSVDFPADVVKSVGTESARWRYPYLLPPTTRRPLSPIRTLVRAVEAARGDDGVEGRDDRHTRQRVRDGNRGRFMPRVIHDREAAEAASGGELITDEVDAPGVVRARGDGPRHARHRDALPVPAPHRESFQPIQPLDALVVHVFAVAAPPGPRRGGPDIDGPPVLSPVLS